MPQIGFWAKNRPHSLLTQFVGMKKTTLQLAEQEKKASQQDELERHT
jgi:hypothetical protein